MDYLVELVERHAEDAAVVRAVVPHGGIGPFIGEALGEVMTSVGEVPVVGPPFCRVEMAGSDFGLEVGFPVERPIEPSGRVVASGLPAGLVATTVHHGEYSQVAGAYSAIEEWLDGHGFEPTGAPWESYLDAPDVPNPRTVVCWPCQRRE